MSSSSCRDASFLRVLALLLMTHTLPFMYPFSGMILSSEGLFGEFLTSVLSIFIPNSWGHK